MRITTIEEALEHELHDTELLGSARASLRHAVHCATLAPSSHNSQPWLFHAGERHVELWADRSRALPVVDPFDRELVISCGAALFHLRVALQRLGWRVQVDLLPDPHAPDLLARVALEDFEEPSSEVRILYECLPRRHTNRGSFDARALPAGLVSELVHCAAREGAWAEALEGEAKLEAALLISQADRSQFRDPHFRRELAAWMSGARSVRHDGMPGSVLGLGALESTLAPLFLRTFQWRSGERAAHDQELALGSPLLLVLGTWHEEPAEWLAAGQALEHLLLAACAAGLEASFLNQAVEVSNYRHRLRELAGRSGFAQIVLRMGYGIPAPATPRRTVEEVLLPGPGSLHEDLP